MQMSYNAQADVPLGVHNQDRCICLSSIGVGTLAHCSGDTTGLAKFSFCLQGRHQELWDIGAYGAPHRHEVQLTSEEAGAITFSQGYHILIAWPLLLFMPILCQVSQAVITADEFRNVFLFYVLLRIGDWTLLCFRTSLLLIYGCEMAVSQWALVFVLACKITHKKKICDSASAWIERRACCHQLTRRAMYCTSTVQRRYSVAMS